MKSTELREKRMGLVVQARKLLDAAEAEGRALTAEEREQYDRIMADVDGLTATIERMERISELEARMSEPASPPIKPEPVEQRSGRPTGAPEYRDAFWRTMRHTRNILEPHEFRALQVGTDSEGGYLVPDEFAKTLVQALNEANIMRTLATVISTTSGTMEIPVVSSHGSAAWTAEEAAYTESDEAFSQVTLGAHKAATIIKVSEELLRDSAFDLEGYLASEFARRIGALEEAAFVNGDGSGKPTGVVGGSTLGVTAASASAITSDELIDLYHSLGRQYRQRAVFLMADGTAKVIRKLKDGDNQYLWQPGLQAGQPDTLLGRPVQVSSSMPTIAANAKVILFGDMSYYWIADRQGIVFQRLNELYAANGQVGFRAYERVDGKLTLATAVYHLKMAAS